MTVYVFFEDTEEYDCSSRIVSIFASEEGAVKAMQGAVDRCHAMSHWVLKQVDPLRWEREGHDGDGFHVESWQVIE
jgi:hypothetical protein